MSDETATLQSTLLAAHGFAHGFSTRHGGVSEGPYASLNLGNVVGDDPERVRENHRRLAAHVGYDVGRFHQASQVHGAAVHHAHAGDVPAETWRREADALIARDEAVAVGVRVADCVPVLVGDPATGHVAAVHAGWRGVAQNIVREALRELGAPPARLVAAVGPSIGPCCFEVGDEVADELAAAAGEGIVVRREGVRPHVDLWRAVASQLRDAGVREVDALGRCTRCDPARFFSFRRDGQRSGRMVGVIVASKRRFAVDP